MFEGQRWILNMPKILVWYTGPPSLGLDPKDPAISELEACWKLFVIWHSWNSICQPHDWQLKPRPTAPSWHLDTYKSWSKLSLETGKATVSWASLPATVFSTRRDWLEQQGNLRPNRPIDQTLFIIVFYYQLQICLLRSHLDWIKCIKICSNKTR